MKLFKTFSKIVVVNTILLILIAYFLLASCSKEKDLVSLPAFPPAPPAIANKPPFANAGRDKTITLPVDQLWLDGGASFDPDGSITSYYWQKISGPDCRIESPNALQSKVTGLQQGIYQFELTVVDTTNLFGRDTVQVTVFSLTGANSIIFHSLNWIFPWYASIEVKNVNSYVPPNTTLKVFVQRGFDPTWIEVNYLSNSPVNYLYEYFIETRPYGAGMYNYGSLYIFYYGTNTSDTPSVKIQF